MGAQREFTFPDISEDQPAGMCYTSGTAGRPKGVECTHKMYYAHSLMVMTPAGLNIDSEDVVLSMVPMYHVNSWEFPYASTMTGTKQVYPSPSPETPDVVRLIESKGVTLSAGVPTIWIDLLDYLDTHGVGLDSLERIIVGGSVAPESMMRRYENEYDVSIDHVWGMTETMSIGSVSRPNSDDYSDEAYYGKRKMQGLLSPGLEMKVHDDDGNRVLWTGEDFGELYVHGPTVATEYYNQPEANETDFDSDWFKTGDIVAIDEDGYIDVVDRSGDVIKSGGESMSSIELENALMANDHVLEAAVIAVPEQRWQERPLACVVLKEDMDVSPETLRESLRTKHDFPDWWLPDNIEVVESIPKTATGKFDKKALRDEFDDAELRWTPRTN